MTARTYSASTEIKSAADFTGDFFGGEEFSEFASNYVEKLLCNQPLCSEWVCPLLSAPGILSLSLMQHEGSIFDLPACNDIPEQFTRLLSCAQTKSLVLNHARDLMRISSGSNDGPHSSQAAKNENPVCDSQIQPRDGYRVVNLANISMSCYQACLFMVPSGPFGRKLSLVVYICSNTQNKYSAGKFFTLLRSDTPPGNSSA